MAAVLRSLRAHWFLIALVVVMAAGVLGYESLRVPAESVPRDWLIALIMLTTSAPLELSRRLTGADSLKAVGVGLLVNAALAPPLAWVASQLLAPPLALGLVVAAMAPCTLASAAVWTRKGGGNEAAALLVTVITNLGCFVVLPFWATMLIDQELAAGAARSVEASALARRLLLVVVLPLVCGQLLRRSLKIRAWCDHHRGAIGLVPLLGVLTMVFVGSVEAGQLLSRPETSVGWVDGLVLLLCAAVLHTLLFAIGWALGRAIAPREEALAAAVSGSQKTLTVGLDVALGFGGLVIVPMVAYHALQLLIDAVLVDRLGRHITGQEGPHNEEEL